MSRSRRRQARGRVLLWISPLVAAAAVAAVAIALPSQAVVAVRTDADSAGPLEASYQTVTSWGTGYTGQYTITDAGTAAVSGWTLAFQLPGGTSISSLWDGAYTGDAGKVTVTSDSWDATIQPGGSVSVGFVTTSAGQVGQPAGCLINGTSCQGGGSPAPFASASSSPPTSPTASASASPPPSASASPPPSMSASRGCTPEWGGVTPVGADPVAAQIGALRAIGGDVRISFGGKDGSELAQTRTSVSQLEAAYQDVISAYDVNKIDFDIEGAAVADTAANSRRDQALAALQGRDPGLQVSFTLPVLPSGLPADEDAVLTGAAQAGVDIAAVNVMAMDYGDGAAPDPSGQLGTFAIDAATATDAQVASALGISEAAAWSKVAVTR